MRIDLLRYSVFMLTMFVLKVSAGCNHRDVRLVNNSAPNEGRVEVCIDGYWVSVCGGNWDDSDAQVVCRQLEYTPIGAQASINNTYKQVAENYSLDYVRCVPAKDMLIMQCWYLYQSNQYHTCHHARVTCTNDQRVKSVNATFTNTLHESVHTLVVTWEQNTTVEEPTSFEVECHNSHYRLVTSVSRQRTTTQLSGFLPSSSYTCCVSAEYEGIGYTAPGICTEINTNTQAATNIDSMCQAVNSTSIIGGVIGFILAVVLMFALSGAALVCLLLRPDLKRRIFSPRLSSKPNEGSSSYLRTSSRPNAMATLGQFDAVATEQRLTILNQSNPTDYSSLGPAYESIDSTRLQEERNQALIRERYEFAEMHNSDETDIHVDEDGITRQSSVEDDYSQLQH